MAPKYISHLFLAFLLLSVHSFVAQSRNLKTEKNSGFKYLQNLEGVDKGQVMEGINEVKRYLKKFGYYPNNYADTKLTTNDFDDALESALKTYQKRYRLNVTGIIDSNTIKEMMIPRCGMPDIINHPSSKPTGETKHDHKSNKFHMVAHYSFFSGMPTWPSSKYDLTYSLMSGVEVVDKETLRGVVSQAFKKWADVSQFTFQEAPEGEQSDLVIGFYSGDHGDGEPFDGPGMILAHSFSPTDGRFHYDADENWSTNPDGNQIDLESVAIHEIGHLLGLGHSEDPSAIMYASIPPGTVKRDLAQDDIDGIQALYYGN